MALALRPGIPPQDLPPYLIVPSVHERPTRVFRALMVLLFLADINKVPKSEHFSSEMIFMKKEPRKSIAIIDIVSASAPRPIFLYASRLLSL